MNRCSFDSNEIPVGGGGDEGERMRFHFVGEEKNKRVI